MHLQITFDNSILGEHAVSGVAKVCTMGNSGYSLARLKWLLDLAANLNDFASVVTARQATALTMTSS